MRIQAPPQSLPLPAITSGVPTVYSADELRSHVKGTAFTVVGAFAGRLGLFAIMVIISRLAGPVGVGSYSLAYSIASSAALIALLGSSSGLTRLVAELAVRNRARLSAVVTAALTTTMLFGLALAVAIVALAPTLAHRLYGDPGLAEALTVSGLTVLPMAGSPIFFAVLFGLGETTAAAWVNIVSAVGSIFITLALTIWYGSKGAVWALCFSQCLLWSLAFLTMLWRAGRNECSVLGRFGWQDLRDGQRIAVPSFIANSVMAPAIFLLNTLVSRQFGLHALGHFAVAMQMFQAMAFIPGAINGPMLAFLSRSYARRDRSFQLLAADNIRLLMAISLSLSAALILLARPVIAGVYGGEFQNAVWPAIVLIAAGLPMAVGSMLGIALLAGPKPWRASVAALCWFVLLAVSASLTVRFGLVEVAICVLGAYVAAGAVQVWLCDSELRRHLRGLWSAAAFTAAAITSSALLQLEKLRGDALTGSLAEVLVVLGAFYVVLNGGLRVTVRRLFFDRKAYANTD